MSSAAAATDGRIRSYEDFARVHAYLLAASGIPPSLHERLYRKLADEVFDGGEVFAVEPCEEGRQRRVVLAAEEPLGRESDVFLVDHAWSFRLSDALKQLREVPGLAERMAALMCVDLDRRIDTEESDEHDGDRTGSLEHVLQIVEKEKARIQESGSDSAAWIELEELGIDDDMLIALDLSAKFPNMVALNLWGNKLQDTEKVIQEIRKCPKLKALWLNENPVLGKGIDKAVLDGLSELEIYNSHFFQNLFKVATDEGCLSTLRGRQAKLRLSLYADDAVIFVNPIKQDVDMVLDIMQWFGDATGLKINLQKSSVAPIRCQELNLEDILSSFPGQRVSFPITYLGIPIVLGRLRLVHIQHIQDKALHKMAGWQCKLLNPGGRRVLVRSVLSSLPVYLLTVIKPPKQFIKSFDKVRRRFLWAGNQHLHGGKCKVSWARLQRPINRGGLGITDLEVFSRALRLRWLWFEWKHPDRPWIGMELPVDEMDRALFSTATKVTVHNGTTASFWWSSWVDGQAPALLFPSLYKHSKRKKRTVAAALQNEQWIADVAYDLTVQLVDELVQLWGLIEDIHFNPNAMEEDSIIWTRTRNGEYTARSAYDMQFEGGLLSAFPKLVWNIWAPSRCKFFMWLMLQNRVWTADRLLQREWPNCYFCQFCFRNLETAHHLFSECPVTCSIWNAISTWSGCPSLHSASWTRTGDLVEWFQGLSAAASRAKVKGARSLAILVVWTLWCERNARIFNVQEKPMSKLIEDIKDTARFWCSAGAKHLALLLDHSVHMVGADNPYSSVESTLLESIVTIDLSDRCIHKLPEVFSPSKLPSLSKLNIRGNPLDQISGDNLLKLFSGFTQLQELEVDIPGPLGSSAISILEALPNLSLLNGVNSSSIIETGKHIVDSALQPRLPEWSPEEPLAERVIGAMWLYLMTYRLADEEKIDETPIWYVMDELGSAMRHSDNANFRIAPFLFMPEGKLDTAISYTILWPTHDVQTGEECTRDFLFGIGEEKQRSARLTAWFRTPENYFIQEFRKYQEQLQSNSICSSTKTKETPSTKSVRPSDGRALRVYTDIPHVEEFLTRPEFVLTTDPKEADIVWTSMQVDSEVKNALGLTDQQYTNQFPFEACLVMKHHLAETIHKAWGSPEWLQPTYNLETHLSPLIGDYCTRKRDGMDNLWIMKPWNMARTIDTTVTGDLSAIIRLMETGPKICQKYIERPVLFQGRKFDLRYIVLVRSIRPLEIFLSDVFWVRLANNQYTLEKTSFFEYETHFTVMNYIGRMNHMNTPEFIKEFEKEHQVKWLEIHESIRSMIRCVFESAAAVHPEMQNPFSRAIYGVDVMLDSRFKPKILEVTYCPDCGRACKYDTQALVGSKDTIKGSEFFNTVFGCLFLDEQTNVSPL